MNTNELFPKKYLAAEDMEDDAVVTIKSVHMETLRQKDGTEQQKPIVFFQELDKGLVLNKTNCALIEKQHGAETDGWAGKTVTLTVMQVESFGEIVDAIRVKQPRKGKPAEAAKSWPGAVVTAMIAEKVAKNSFEATAILGMSGFGPEVKAADAIEFGKVYRSFRDEGGMEPEAAADATKAKLAAL